MIWHAYVVNGTAPPRKEADGSTTSHIEWQVQKALINLGAKTIVPGEWEWRKGAKGKMVPGKKPACQGYVIAGFDVVPWQALRLVPGLIGCVSFDGTPAILTAADCMAVAAMERPLNKVQCVEKFSKDQRVRIKTGPHAELPGVVQAWKAGKVITLVEMFGKSFEVTVDESAVEAA